MKLDIRLLLLGDKTSATIFQITSKLYKTMEQMKVVMLLHT